MFKKNGTFLFLCMLTGFVVQLNADPNEAFIKSFLGFYEMHKEGRYTHEYHPYLLKKAAQSFDQLEQKLRNDGFAIPHRMVIMGYEGQAAPTYFFDPNQLKGGTINDEVYGLSLCGVAQPAHNMFGLMTGFLLRNMKKVAGPEAVPSIHVRPHTISLFDERASIFQADAFGNLYHLIRASEKRVLSRVATGDQRALMQELVDFWREVYGHAVLTGAQQVAGTQDILFTIEHGRHIRRSPVPLKKFCTGADITYPINKSTRMTPRATVNAQTFVKKFVKNLTPVNNEKTIYIFRSFVDGVGKSTMLGNVKNWLEHDNAVEKYASVDNASSQFAEVFQCSENVFIGDLPAQLSHFTYKPDGDVFVDIRATTTDESACAELQKRLVSKLFMAERKYRQLLQECYERPSHELLTTPHDTPDRAYAKNMLLLNKQNDFTWIPVCDGGSYYLIHRTQHEIRVCKPIAEANSEGLKNADPEQMIFRQGLRFPMPYHVFLDDLSSKCKKEGITQIVFVDFLSMYSRSSRENVRINYLIQHLKQWAAADDYRDSLYRSMVTNAELYCQLKDRESSAKARRYLASEALLRSALFYIVQTEEFGDVQAVPLPVLVERLTPLLQDFEQKYSGIINSIIDGRARSELCKLHETYHNNKEVVHLLESNPLDLLALSDCVEHHMASLTLLYQNPWENLGGMVDEEGDVTQGACSRIVEVLDGEPMRALYVFNPEDRHLKLMAGLYQLVRKWWYPTILSSAGALDVNGKLLLKKVLFPTVPVVVRQGKNGFLYVLQKIIPTTGKKIRYPRAEDLNARNPYSITWGLWAGMSYITDWEISDTYTGMFGYCYTPFKLREQKPSPQWMDYAMNEAMNQLISKKRNDEVTGVTDVLAELHRSRFSTWNYVRSEFREFIKREAQNKGKKAAPSAKNARKKSAVIELPREATCVAQRAIRLLATIDMVAHDAHSPIAVHRGKQKDFVAAAELIQDGVLAQYGELFVPKSLWTKNEILMPNFLNVP
jgi:hypothetical protein